MVSIVYCHTLGTFTVLKNPSFESSFFWVLGPMKFGTICFYLISGFLLGDKITETPSLTYLKRRFDNTFQPYLIAVISFSLFFSLSYFTGLNQVQSVKEYGIKLAQDFIEIILFTNYWFIVNFFISLSIILLFKKYLFTWPFALTVFLLTVGYTINIYLEYFEPRHTAALFGFIFYLWLGIVINRYKKEVIGYIDETRSEVVLFLCALLIGLNIYESYVLKALNSMDAMNTLKISNQLYSLLVFAILIKFRSIRLPVFFNPKKDTYGIYLYHSFFITILFKGVLMFSHLSILHSNFLLIISFLTFIVVYLSTLIVVKCLNNPPSKWSEEIKIFSTIQKA
jgi:fucose 4-O-acetylase-like acetyltransferase